MASLGQEVVRVLPRVGRLLGSTQSMTRLRQRRFRITGAESVTSVAALVAVPVWSCTRRTFLVGLCLDGFAEETIGNGGTKRLLRAEAGGVAGQGGRRMVGNLNSYPGRAYVGSRTSWDGEVGEHGGGSSPVQVLQALHGSDPFLSVHVSVELLIEGSAPGRRLLMAMQVRVALVVALWGPVGAGETQLHATQRRQTFVPQRHTQLHALTVVEDVTPLVHNTLPASQATPAPRNESATVRKRDISVHRVAGVAAAAYAETGSLQKDVPVLVDVLAEAVGFDRHRGGGRGRVAAVHRLHIRLGQLFLWEFSLRLWLRVRPEWTGAGVSPRLRHGAAALLARPAEGSGLTQLSSLSQISASAWRLAYTSRQARKQTSPRLHGACLPAVRVNY